MLFYSKFKVLHNYCDIIIKALHKVITFTVNFLTFIKIQAIFVFFNMFVILWLEL